MEDRYTQLVEYIARGLVDHPEDVSVRVRSAGEGHVVELSVLEDDRGKVIGRKGRTAHAIRTLLDAAADGERVSLDIVD